MVKNMITELDIDKISTTISEIDDEMQAVLIESVRIDRASKHDLSLFKTSSKLKLQIPRIMPEIPVAKPSIDIAYTPNFSLFKNDKSCAPSFSSNIILKQNYLETDDVSLNTKGLDEHSVEKTNPDGSVKVTKWYTLPEGTIGTAKFLDKMVSKLTFSSGKTELNYKD